MLLIPSASVSAFATPAPRIRVTSDGASGTTSTSLQQEVGNILILDHLNINHEKGRHDLLKAFYFDFLNCAVDPRKEENIAKGTKTLWANIGAQQFHLPEGKPSAQVFDGLITLSYRNFDGLRKRYRDKSIRAVLDGTKFDMEEKNDELLVTDPWGSTFKIVISEDPEAELDPRGVQKGGPSEGLAMRDLTVYAPVGSNFAGIGRYYEQVLSAPLIECVDGSSCTISVGPRQTLTFTSHPGGPGASVSHDDLHDEGEIKGATRQFLSNYGPHISMYVADLRKCYNKAAALGLAYVNPRFKRRSYTLDEAVDECMFRLLDIVDPENVEAGPILKLEHEVRSVVKRDGSKYKSCPFDEIPECCVV